MKNNYYDLKQIKPNKVMKFKLRPRESGKSDYISKLFDEERKRR